MSLLASGFLAQNLHETNSRLGFWLEGLRPRDQQAPSENRAATPEQMAGLLSALMRAGEWLRRLPAVREPELELELSKYRRNVERLRELLPSIHDTLLRERARLEGERVRLESATEWARGSRQTL